MPEQPLLPLLLRATATVPRRAAVFLVTGIALTVLAACDPVEPDVPAPATTCDGPGGTTHTGVVETQTWPRADGPHRIVDTLTVTGDLTIEAGTLVCGGPGAVIYLAPVMPEGGWPTGIPQGGWLIARGTAEAPITFTPAQPDQRWGGIVGESFARVNLDLAHVILEDADVGVALSFGQVATVEHAVIRRMAGVGVRAGNLTLRDAVVDSACQGGAAHCFAAGAPYNEYRVVIERVRIRDSGGGGFILAGRGSTIEFEDVRIEGSQGMGLHIGNDSPRGTYGTVTRAVPPLIITGGASYPASIPTGVVEALLPTLEAQDRWVGNAADTILVSHVWTRTTISQLTIGPRLAWKFIQIFVDSPPRISELRMLPGATLIVAPPFETNFGSPMHLEALDARGTAEEPVVIRGVGTGAVVLTGAPGTPSRLAHARLEAVIMDAQPGHPLHVEDVLATGSFLGLAADSRLTRATLRGDRGFAAAYLWTHFGSVQDLTHPLRIQGPRVVVADCDVSGSSGAGIRADSAEAVSVHDCSLHDNAGPGILNLAPTSLDARHNWWGDPAGPFGPEGDGVEGAVEFEPYRTSPVAGSRQ